MYSNTIIWQSIKQTIVLLAIMYSKIMNNKLEREADDILNNERRWTKQVL